MPVDQSFVGRSYPPTPAYEVSREKIREFADAINDPNPAYRDVEAARALGHADVIAPPTFAIVLTLPAGARSIADPEARHRLLPGGARRAALRAQPPDRAPVTCCRSS